MRLELAEYLIEKRVADEQEGWCWFFGAIKEQGLYLQRFQTLVEASSPPSSLATTTSG